MGRGGPRTLRRARTGLADQLLKLAADFESTGLAPDLLNAIDRASKEVAAAPRPKGGISGLMRIYGLMKQPETQQAIHFAVATLCSLCQARVPKGESHQERDRERRQRIPLEGSQRQRVFIRLPHAMFMTAAGTQRSASEVIAKVTGTEATPAHSRRSRRSRSGGSPRTSRPSCSGKEPRSSPTSSSRFSTMTSSPSRGHGSGRCRPCPRPRQTFRP